MENRSLNSAEKKEMLKKLVILKKRKEENKKKQEKEIEENRESLEDSNNQIKALNQRKLEYAKSIEKSMSSQKNKKKEYVTKINNLRSEIGTLDLDTIKSKGKSEKEKKYFELVDNYKKYLKFRDKLFSSPRQHIDTLDKEITEINKKHFGTNKVFQKKLFELKKEESVLSKEIKSLEEKLGLSSDVKAVKFELKDELVNTSVGAKMPYIRYSSEEAKLGEGATLITSPDHSQENIASQGSNQSYIQLPKSGSYAEWTMHSVGNGITMRFTMPDSSDGMGEKGSLDIYVNEIKKLTVNLTSYYMWQYFPSGNPSDSPGGAPNFAFDEVHFMLNPTLKLGDKIRVQSSGANGHEYGVDFLEIEEVGDPISQPENSLSVTEFGAIPDDGDDDYAGIIACISAADEAGKDVYFPPGTYNINEIWRLDCQKIKITGAGIWYTKIQFTNDQPGSGGISGGVNKDGYCKNIEFCNMYINSNLRSRYNQQAVYKCFMDVFSEDSIIHDIWQEHFECGFWIADYGGELNYSDGLKIVNCRIRNNLADGVNFCQGTSNAMVYNCSIRNNGDDGLAMWNDSTFGAKDESNNIFCYNTIEFIWRAGGIAIYGGNGHKVYNNYIRDTHMSAGIHLNTTFNGHKFSNNDKGIEFSNNILIKTGSSKGSWGEEFGAIDLDGNVKNVIFNNNYIFDAQHDGIHFGNLISDIFFNNIHIYGAGTDGQEANYSSLFHKGAAIQCYGTVESVTIKGITVANIACKGTKYGAEEIGNYINLTNITIEDERVLDKIEYSYPGLPKNGTIKVSRDIEIPDPQEIEDQIKLKSSPSIKNIVPIYEKEKIIHSGYICDGCNGPIIGIRYKCVVCENFDYCEKCEDEYKGGHGHPLLKIKNPEMSPIAIKCKLKNNQ